MISLPRNTRLKRVGRRAAAQAGARRKCMAVVRKRSGGVCEAMTPWCKRIGHDGHEKLKRSQGGDPTDPENVMLVCRPCHDFIGQHQSWAYSVGLLVKSWEGRP